MAQQSETSSASLSTIESEDRGKSLDRNQLRSTPGFYRRAWRRFRQDKVAMAALGLAVVILIFSFGAPVVSWLTGYSFARGDLTKVLLAPGEQGHLLGTDANGRDILTRLAYGGRVSMMISVLAVFSALTIGGTVGSVAGYYGGFIDSFLMRLVDVIISIPGITVLLLLSVWFRPGPVGLAFVIAALSWTGIARLV
nr:ABC transporter permease [Chloroflexia bacterium]